MSDNAKDASSEAKNASPNHAPKKVRWIAYLLLFFVGMFGGHRFYFDKNKSAVVQLLLTMLGYILLKQGMSFSSLFFVAVGVWTLVDAFLVPRWIRQRNAVLGEKLAGGETPLSEPTMSEWERVRQEPDDEFQWQRDIEL